MPWDDKDQPKPGDPADAPGAGGGAATLLLDVAATLDAKADACDCRTCSYTAGECERVMELRQQAAALRALAAPPAPRCEAAVRGSGGGARCPAAAVTARDEIGRRWLLCEPCAAALDRNRERPAPAPAGAADALAVNVIREYADHLDRCAQSDEHIATHGSVNVSREAYAERSRDLRANATALRAYLDARIAPAAGEDDLRAEYEALKAHVAATGDDAMRDLLRQYLHENDLLAETARRLTEERDAARRAAGAAEARG